jgi:hypothetical protein
MEKKEEGERRGEKRKRAGCAEGLVGEVRRRCSSGDVIMGA